MPTVNLSTSFSVSSQSPLDIKRYFNTIAEMKNLGTANNRAYQYYECMEVICVENQKKYIWRERIPSEGPGLLDIDFLYPNGVVSNYINYSNRAFNFFEMKGSESYLSLSDTEDENYDEKMGFSPEVSPNGQNLRLVKKERYINGYYTTQEVYSESFAVGNIIRGICKPLDVYIIAEIISLPFEDENGIIDGSLKFYQYNESFI